LKRKFAFVIAFTIMFLLAFVVGTTQASTATTEKKGNSTASTSQTTILSKNNTTTFSNSTLSAQLNELIDSNNFKQAIAKWSTTKNVPPQNKNSMGLSQLDYVWDIHASGIYAYSDGPPWGAGRLYTPYNILWASDGTYAHFHTEVWRPYPDGDEATKREALLLVNALSNKEENKEELKVISK
jgi:hypothetical protein